LFATVFGQDLSKLASVRKIYIDDLGREEGSDLVREKLRVRLMKTDRFSVVEKREAADAVLTGVAGVVRKYNSSVTTGPNGNVSGGGTTSFSGIGVLRLVDLKSDETIWVFEYKRGFSLGSASSRVANKTVEQLLKDLKSLEKKKK
jgi:hypothetical protein